MAQTTKVFGESVLRKEDDRFLTGRGNFVADMLPPGTVFAKFVRSPYAHARIGSINTAKARRLPGVLDVLTAQDLKDQVGDIITAWAIPNANLKTPAYPPLAREVVRYAGEAVAVVVAESPFIAENALDLVEVEYDSLPVVTDVETATKKGGAPIHGDAPDNVAFKWTLAGGDVDKVFKEADVVVSQRFVNQRLQPTAIEPRAAIAQFEPGTRELTLHVTSQNPFVHRLVLSIVLKYPEHLIHVIAPDVGGGFGSKIPVYPWEAIVCHLAMRLGRPVKWVEDRMENIQADSFARDYHISAEIGATRDGKLTALRVKTIADHGYTDAAANPSKFPAGLFHIVTGSYPFEKAHVEVDGVYTNKPPGGIAYRCSFRVTEAAFTIERIVDSLARKLGMDPAEFRLKNFIPPEAFPFKSALGWEYDSGNYRGALRKAMDIVDYDALRKEQAEKRKRGELMGIGISSFTEIVGAGPSHTFDILGLKMFDSCEIRIHPTGKAIARFGTKSQGQGHETTYAQILAEELGISSEDIAIEEGDTDTAPYGLGTYASRSTPTAGAAASIAARKIRDKAQKIAAHLLEVSPDDLEWKDHKFQVKGVPDKAKTMAEIAFAASSDRGEGGRRMRDGGGTGGDRECGRGRPGPSGRDAHRHPDHAMEGVEDPSRKACRISRREDRRALRGHLHRPSLEHTGLVVLPESAGILLSHR